jgi:hypothetical protein
LRAHLRSAGLDVLRDWSAYPSPQSPTVLLNEDALTEPGLHGYLTSVLRRAGLPGGPLLADPRPLAADLLRHHLAAGLAPAWIVAAAFPGHHPAPLPDGLLSEGHLVRTATGWTVATTGWTVATTDRTVVTTGWTAGPVPDGVCLHDALLAAARTGDQPEVRARLTTWQSGPHAATPADALLLTSGGAVVPVSAVPAGAGAPALQRFAAALHDEGLAHLWPADGTAELLAAMSGLPADQPPAARATPSTLRELTASHDRLAEQLAEARAQLIWYEQRTATLQSDLSRAHRIITVLKTTSGGRAATAVLGGVRRGKRLATAALRRLR